MSCLLSEELSQDPRIRWACDVMGYNAEHLHPSWYSTYGDQNGITENAPMLCQMLVSIQNRRRKFITHEVGIVWRIVGI